MNQKFINAIKCVPQAVPPIWFMRQAGRYHSHYQKLRKKYTFEELCKIPELSAEVACGPIDDFDYDVAILFSDILFPLEILGLGLSYSPVPTFSNYLTPLSSVEKIPNDLIEENLGFQAKAIKLTIDSLPNDKSLVGFVGGPWTILSYGLNLKNKIQVDIFNEEPFIQKLLYDVMMPLLKKNIEMQLKAGAEIIYIFDTNSSQLDEKYFMNKYLKDMRDQLFLPFKNKIAYFSKNQAIYQTPNLDMKKIGLSGLVFSNGIGFYDFLKEKNNGFVQGNFSPLSLLKPHDEYVKDFDVFLVNMKEISVEERAGWICSLSHGVLPKTPEENVRHFVQEIRSHFSSSE